MKEPAELDAWVLDVETTQKCPVGNNKANPFWPENEIVLYGWRTLRNGETTTISTCGLRDATSDPCLVIGHNIAFDLHYMLRKKKLLMGWLAKSHVWDTQLAEYLLSGQTIRYPTLDYCAEKRGGVVKDERVKVMFEAGKGADEVPRNMLDEYLRGDLSNTEKVFYSQFAEAMERGMLPLMWSQMDARLATIDMIYNGLAVDRAFIEKRASDLALEVDTLQRELRTAATVLTGEQLDPTSPSQLSIILFGGDIKYKEKEQIGTYKNGNPQFKTFDKKRKVCGVGLVSRLPNGKNGYYPTGDDVLEDIAQRTTSVPKRVLEFVKKVQDYRAKSKELSTYFEGIRALIMPDGLVHHNLNHVVTATGRLSGTDPNLQNVTDGSKSDIKKAFVSRWGDDGVILEADYSQLEMVVLAVLSGDKQLLDDIRNGVDMHKALFKEMHGRDMRPEERKLFKRCSFALVYGAGVGGVAAQGGISRAEAAKFIPTFYNRYPGVKAWHTTLIEEVDAGRYYEGKKDADTGLPAGESCLISPISQRCYVFREYPLDEPIARWKKKKMGFSPTEIKNYPVQGGATGDIVPLVLGKLFRVLRNNALLKDKCLMINTVHDSVLFDVHKDVLEEAIVTIKQTMEAAPRYIKETFGYDFPLQLKVGMSYGPNWLEQDEINFTEERKAA